MDPSATYHVLREHGAPIAGNSATAMQKIQRDVTRKQEYASVPQGLLVLNVQKSVLKISGVLDASRNVSVTMAHFVTRPLASVFVYLDTLVMTVLRSVRLVHMAKVA